MDLIRSKQSHDVGKMLSLMETRLGRLTVVVTVLAVTDFVGPELLGFLFALTFIASLVFGPVIYFILYGA